jgi:hypothetical protein
MDADFTHAYCDNCGAIKPIMREILRRQDDGGNFAGGHILCEDCRFVIVTVYKKRQDDSLPAGAIKQTPDE